MSASPDRRPRPVAAADVPAGPWLSGLPAARREALLGAVVTRRLADGERVYSIGDAPDALYGIVGGSVKMLNYPLDGRQLVNVMMGPGDWFGELSILDGGPRVHDAVAVGATRLAVVPVARWRALAAMSPGHTLDLAVLMGMRLRRAVTAMNELAVHSGEYRLAATLLRLLPAAPAELRVSQEDLADLAGMSRQRVNRLLRRFEGEGLVALGYAHIAVRDEGGLRRRLH